MNNRLMKKLVSVLMSISLTACTVIMSIGVMLGIFENRLVRTEAADSSTITLRVCNWEEYIDDTMIDDFEDWYYEKYGEKIKVEYSCLGTNEELYNMLTLGDEYDLICPSEYMIMKLMAEDWLEPYSDEFFDSSKEDNYYAKGVSPFIRKIFDENKINGESWGKYAAGYMWGITGIVYNPEEVTQEEASTWTIINNPKFKRQITIKDNVRDSMFAAVGAIKSDLLTSASFKSLSDYKTRLADEMNDTSDETIKEVQDYLQAVKDNAYSFETDSAKADMITGKVVAGYQWSGDAVYTLDQAEEDDYTLNFAVPKESTNLYFDGWTMLKSGINNDARKKQAAERFVNFVSMPENAVRNMDYIGYTSVISGGDSDVVYKYVEENYGADEGEKDTVQYPLGYFFSGNSDDERYMLTASKEQTQRQLLAQYPTEEVMERSAIMQYFDKEENAKINQMWINVRCYNIHNIPIWVWIVAALIVILIIAMYVRSRIKKNAIYK